jgi:hypothetical protein
LIELLKILRKRKYASCFLKKCVEEEEIKMEENEREHNGKSNVINNNAFRSELNLFNVKLVHFFLKTIQC